jgi:hypothetical protein
MADIRRPQAGGGLAIPAVGRRAALGIGDDIAQGAAFMGAGLLDAASRREAALNVVKLIEAETAATTQLGALGNQLAAADPVAAPRQYDAQVGQLREQLLNTLPNDQITRARFAASFGQTAARTRMAMEQALTSRTNDQATAALDTLIDERTRAATMDPAQHDAIMAPVAAAITQLRDAGVITAEEAGKRWRAARDSVAEPHVRRRRAIDLVERTFNVQAFIDETLLTAQTVDLSDPAAQRQINDLITQKQQAEIQEHLANGGSPETAAALYERFETMRAGVQGKLGAIAQTQVTTKMQNALDAQLAPLVARVQADPDSLSDALVALQDTMEAFAGAIPDAEWAETLQTRRAALGNAAVQAALDAGDFDRARQLLNQTPGVAAALGADRQTQLGRLIQTTESVLKAERQKLLIEERAAARERGDAAIADLTGRISEGVRSGAFARDTWIGQPGMVGEVMRIASLTGETPDDVINRITVGTTGAAGATGPVEPGTRIVPGVPGETGPSIEALPGSAEARKREAEQVKAFQREQTTRRDAGIVVKEIDRALAILETPSALPVTGLFSIVARQETGSSAAELRSATKTIGNILSLVKLQEIRENSPTGGALGSVSDKEGDRLEGSLGDLSTLRNAEALRQTLKDIRGIMLDSMYGSEEELEFNVRIGRITPEDADELRRQRAEVGFDIIGRAIEPATASARPPAQPGTPPAPSAPAARPDDRLAVTVPAPTGAAASPEAAAPEVAASAADLAAESGLPPLAVAALLGNLIVESGMDPAARNPGDGRDGSDSVGIAQWNADRAKRLQAFAKETGGDAGGIRQQARFLLWEMQTTERDTYEKLLAANTIEEATAIAVGFFRPAGWTKARPEAAHSFQDRLAAARGALGVVEQAAGDMPPPAVLEGMNDVDRRALRAIWPKLSDEERALWN